MFKVNYLVLAALFFSSVFAKEESYLDKAKNYSNKALAFATLNAKKAAANSKLYANKAKTYAWKHKIKLGAGLAGWAGIAGTYGYYMGQETAKKENWSLRKQILMSSISGTTRIIPDIRKFAGYISTNFKSNVTSTWDDIKKHAGLTK